MLKKLGLKVMSETYLQTRQQKKCIYLYMYIWRCKSGKEEVNKDVNNTKDI